MEIKRFSDYLVEETKEITFVFGRFNPPTTGHEKLFTTLKKIARGGAYRIYASKSQDAKKNPLQFKDKIKFLRKIFPKHARNIMADSDVRHVMDIGTKLYDQGFTKVTMVAGSDRIKEFDILLNKYNGVEAKHGFYQFEGAIKVVSAGERDPDAEGVEGLSASRLRLAASENDYKTFKMAMPDGMAPKEVKDLYNTLRMSMGINEEWGIWEMAPKFDQQTLRENYVSKTIYRIGEWVENMNTGLVGKIVRRGANHLICVTEDDIMFKSWIRDVNEAIVNGTDIGGVPADQRLVGTDSHFNYVSSMVPGAMSSGIAFINKYKIGKRKS